MSQDQKKPKYPPGRLGQQVDRSVKLVASWPAQDRRSVEIRRQTSQAESKDQTRRA